MPEDLSTFKFQNRHGTDYGKPKFPEELESYRIVDYIGPDSPGLFVMIRLDPSFLYRPVSTWHRLDAYNEAKKRVRNLKVINDGAERGVKLTSDFLGCAKTEDRLQNVLQTVENDRKLAPDQRKSSRRN